MKRRDLLKNTALLASLSAHPHSLLSATQSIPGEFSPLSTDRLDQGPFYIDQDEGWRAIDFTFGNVWRNILVGPGEKILDGSIQKEFTLIKVQNLNFELSFSTC